MKNTFAKITKSLIIPFGIAFLLCNAPQLQAQRNAIGVRLGGTTGITLRAGVGDNAAIEAILGGYPYGPSVTILGEAHKSLGDVFSLYAGGGGHIRFGRDWYRERNCYPLYGCHTYQNGETGVGIDLIGGVEAKIPALPLAFSLDIKPFLEWTNENKQYAGYDLGLGIKVVF
jgi:hypothetical protein